MQLLDNNKQAFLALVRAGLWEQEARLLPFGEVDFSEVQRLAEEQSVVGLVAAGLEHVVDVKVPQVDFLTFVGRAVQIEQQNSAMNDFIGVLIDKMRKAGIYTLLVKGQGIAQCYERPLWRSCGDVDLFLSDENYIKAKEFLIPLASSVDSEWTTEKHLGMTIDSWIVELHGYLHTGLSNQVDKVLDELQKDTFCHGNVGSCVINRTQVFLPSPDNDVIFIFTHFLKHFYKEGLGLRQICDWCRLLWTHKKVLNVKLLEKRLRSMGLMDEWKGFAAMAIDYLGMPVEAMPLYSPKKKWSRKGEKIYKFVMEVGNMGHNRDSIKYTGQSYWVRKAMSFSRRCGDLIRHARIFPLESLRFFPSIVYNGLREAARGEG